MRELSSDELDFVRQTLVKVLKHMVHNVVEKVKGYLPAKDMMFYSRFVAEEFIDELDEAKEKEPEKIRRLEEAHYTLLFLFDLLQFSYQFLTEAKTKVKVQE